MVDIKESQLVVKKIPAIDCWRLIYGNDNIINVFEQSDRETVTVQNVFCGTQEECNAKIKELGLTFPAFEETTRSSILNLSEKEKYELQIASVTAVRKDPKITITGFKSGMNWKQQALVDLLIAAYTRRANELGMVSVVDPTAPQCWDVMKGIILKSTDEQLAALLR